MEYYNKIHEAVIYLRKKYDKLPQIGIILGSGLGGFCDSLGKKVEINYINIPNFPQSTVKGHAGKLIFTESFDKTIVIMQGRFHFYEGYSMKEITLPVRVFSQLGVEILIVTNSAGGINPEFSPGDFMLIKDHINLMGLNPLIGLKDNRLGPQFPSMNKAYDPYLNHLAEKVANRLKINIKKGVYVAVTGPNYETPAEVKMLRTLGGDAVGMSTVPEVIAAVHSGMKVIGISCITNIAGHMHGSEKGHESVINMANQRSPEFIKLISGIIKEVNTIENV